MCESKKEEAIYSGRPGKTIGLLRMNNISPGGKAEIRVSRQEGD